MTIGNKVLLSLSMLLLICTLSACEQTEQSQTKIIKENEQSLENRTTVKEQKDISYSFKNPKTGQEFTILHLYMLYENFFETVKDYPDESPYELFEQKVIEPVYDACIKDAEYYKYSVYEWTPEESVFTNIQKQIESMDKDHFNRLFEESLIKSSDLLPSDKRTTVCVFPQTKGFPAMGTIGSGKILVSYNEGLSDDFLQFGIAHEYHHSVWFEKHYTGDYLLLTNLDGILMEGQAMMFETLLYPDSNSTDYTVDESFNKEHWNVMESFLDSSYKVEFLIGGFYDLPKLYGYSEGYKMIRSYLNLHPNMAVEEWTSKSSKEIFEEGNYTANYE